MTIDVEDWFHVANLSGEVDRSDWAQLESRVVDNTLTILDILGDHETKATFFVLGWVAERFPDLVKEIDNRDHEVASHGYNHKLIYEMCDADFRKDLETSRDILGNITGKAPNGYRAPNFSITDGAIDVLKDVGFKYDSSLFPSVMHDRYGSLKRANENGVLRDEGIREVPISVNPIAGINVPWGGGGYFRLMPYKLYKRGIESILEKVGFFSFYLHSWEIDSAQPKINDIPFNYKFRHYYGLEKAQNRLKLMLSDFNFKPIKEGLEKFKNL